MNRNETETANQLWAESALSFLIRKIKEYRYVVCSCLIFGFLSYMFVFTNKLVNWDELTAIFSKGATIESGRWGLEILSYLIPDYSMPWLFGCETLLCMTVSMCLLMYVFEIKTPVLQVMLSGLIIVFPALTGTFAYMFTSSSYGVSFLLMMLALYLLTRKGWGSYSGAVVCLVLSVGIYQSYVMVLSSFLILLLIRRLMYTENSAKQVFFQGVRYLIYLAISMGVYFLVTKAFNEIAGIPMGSYAQGAMKCTDPLFVRIQNTYLSFYKVLFENEKGLVAPGISSWIHIAIVGFSAAECLIWIGKKRDFAKGALLVLLLAMLPVAIFGMYLASSVRAVHTLVLYSFVAVYVLAVMLMEKRNWAVNPSKLWSRCRAGICNAVIVGMLVIIYCNVTLANEAYLKLYLSHQNMISFSTSLVAELNTLPEYEHSTPVAFVGTYPKPAFYEEFDNLENLMGLPVLTPNWRTTYNYCGYDMAMASTEEIEALKKLPEVQQMPSYPNHGCIQIVDGFVVVKFSD